jgi:hypothetical protein
MNNKRYWHYTTFENMDSIIKSGVIIRATTYVPKFVKPVVWFSTNPEWEGTVYKKIVNVNEGWEKDLLTKQDFLSCGIPPTRIEVDPKAAGLKSWNNYKRNSGDSKQFIVGLERAARELNANPKEWYISYQDVSIDCFLNIEVWNGEQWVDLRSLNTDEQIRLQQPQKKD